MRVVLPILLASCLEIIQHVATAPPGKALRGYIINRTSPKALDLFPVHPDLVKEESRPSQPVRLGTAQLDDINSFNYDHTFSKSQAVDSPSHHRTLETHNVAQDTFARGARFSHRKASPTQSSWQAGVASPIVVGRGEYLPHYLLKTVLKTDSAISKRKARFNNRNIIDDIGLGSQVVDQPILNAPHNMIDDIGLGSQVVDQPKLDAPHAPKAVRPDMRMNQLVHQLGGAAEKNFHHSDASPMRPPLWKLQIASVATSKPIVSNTK